MEADEPLNLIDCGPGMPDTSLNELEGNQRKTPTPISRDSGCTIVTMAAIQTITTMIGGRDSTGRAVIAR